MGLFTRASRHTLPEDQWRPDGTGVETFSGNIGGDIERGRLSYSVRFIRPDLPGSIITVAFYAVEYDECPGEFLVQRQVEWMVCEDWTDPGGTEIWSEEARDDMQDAVMDTADEAESKAREYAEFALGDDSYFGWDGQPDWNREAI